MYRLQIYLEILLHSRVDIIVSYIHTYFCLDNCTVNNFLQKDTFITKVKFIHIVFVLIVLSLWLHTYSRFESCIRFCTSERKFDFLCIKI